MAGKWRQPTYSLDEYPSISDSQVSKAMIFTSLPGSLGTDKEAVDTLRLLTQAQSDISSRDINEFWKWYTGPVDVAEIMSMFSQDLIQSEFDLSDDEDIFPLLAVALKGYGEDPSQWENFLRLLLRERIGLHSPVPRDYVVQIHDTPCPFPCKLLEFGTPLDELFSTTKTPFEGDAAADRWLQVLSSEGYDVVAYLEEESALHAEQMSLTYPCTCE